MSYDYNNIPLPPGVMTRNTEEINTQSYSGGIGDDGKTTVLMADMNTYGSSQVQNQTEQMASVIGNENYNKKHTKSNKQKNVKKKENKTKTDSKEHSESKDGKRKRALSTFGWFICMVLYAIPGVNIISSFIMCLSKKYIDRKRWAKVALAFSIISTCLIAIGYIRLCNMTFETLFDIYTTLTFK